LSIFPKKNAKVGGSWKWKRELFHFVSDPFGHLKEYFKRNNSESGFSADKRRFGWIVRQKRDDRMDTALFSNHLWHNLFLLAT
jgi:transposase